jgi:hypothetical protein
MSEVKLNLISSQTILSGTIHGSVIDSCIAALSAEPETIAELVAALERYIKPRDDVSPFAWFHPQSSIDEQPYDAGIVIIDLAARIIAAESTYSHPQPDGEVDYHNGNHATDVRIPYRVPPDWLFVNSLDAHRWARERRLQSRAPFFDARVVLYGDALPEFIVKSLTPELRSSLRAKIPEPQDVLSITSQTEQTVGHDKAGEHPLTKLHATWLTTPRADLRNRSPRDVMLEKQDFIDFDLHTRSLQWSLLNEGPPCLARDSFAYRFAGFGTHEWVIYYDLVRDLLERAVEFDCQQADTAIKQLERLKTDWLENPLPDYDGRTPANILENERKRLPEAMSPEQLIIDEDCECCRMLAQDAAMGFGPGFWHLDGSHMEEEFAFSFCKTFPEWELELQRREESYREFERQWAEREHARRSSQREWDEEQIRAACGEPND